MKTMLIAIASFPAAGMMLAQAAHAEGTYEYQIDSVHSSVLFSVKHRNVSYVFGRFGKISGTITVDRKRNPSTLRINAEVDTRSLDTNDRNRDRHLKTEDFFNAKKFRTARFETTEVEKLEDGKFRLSGDMTLLGTTLPVTVEFEVTGEKSVGPGHRIGGKTTFTVKRSDFGMSQMIGDISDEVTVIVSLQAEHRSPPAG